MENKRGQGLSTSTIILLVLGIVVLVILIVGFTTGWKPLGERLNQDNNVKNVVADCQTACLTDSKYDFCSYERTLKATDLPGGVNEVKGNCTYFTSSGFEKYGIESCPGLC